MLSKNRLLVVAAIVLSPSALQAQADQGEITRQIQGLRDVPDAQRPAVTIQIAKDIRMLPAGLPKLKLADALTHLVTEGDPGREALQTVADTLAHALSETPQPVAKDGHPAMPYMDIAKLARYEGIVTDLKDPMLVKADEMLAANDAEIEKADFTLKALNGKKYTLSQLRGKIVLVNFWATWCPPCRKEMPDLDLILTHYQSQGLVILSITDENPFKVNSFLASHGTYHPAVLIDDGDKVTKQFHVDGLPKTFVFDRDGKLVAQSIDMRTQRQFFLMLAKAGLHP